MDPEKVALLDGKVRAVHHLNLTTQFLDESYRLERHDEPELKRTGRLEIFRLVPKHSGALPSFAFRWDEHGESNEGALDVDLVGSARDQRLFKNGRGGWSGHHTVRTVALDRREFAVNITAPNPIFRAIVSFGVHRAVGLDERVENSERLEVE
jgi:hypothetical protein